MKVSFIGLGVQGKYLAINLADAGHDLMVYDLRAEPLAELARHGQDRHLGEPNSKSGAEILAGTGKLARSLPGFKPRDAWSADLRRGMT